MRKILVLILSVPVLLAGCAANVDDSGRKAVGLEVSVDEIPWQTPAGPGRELVTDNYRIFTTVTRNPLARHIPGYMEAAYEYYLDLTGLSDIPGQPKKAIYILADRKQWAALTVDKMGQRSAPYMQIGAGGYCYAGVCVLWDIGTRGTLSVAGHEGMHQFLHWRMKDQLPMWIEEGICAQVEGHLIYRNSVKFTPKSNPSRLNSLRNLLANGKWVDIPQLLPMDAGDVVGKDPNQAVGYYGQLWALILFMQQHPQYSQGLKNIFQDAEKGNFRETLKMDPAQFNSLKASGRVYNRVTSVPLFAAYISEDFETFNSEYKQFSKQLAELE